MNQNSLPDTSPSLELRRAASQMNPRESTNTDQFLSPMNTMEQFNLSKVERDSKELDKAPTGHKSYKKFGKLQKQNTGKSSSLFGRLLSKRSNSQFSHKTAESGEEYKSCRGSSPLVSPTEASALNNKGKKQVSKALDQSPNNCSMLLAMDRIDNKEKNQLSKRSRVSARKSKALIREQLEGQQPVQRSWLKKGFDYVTGINYDGYMMQRQTKRLARESKALNRLSKIPRKSRKVSSALKENRSESHSAMDKSANMTMDKSHVNALFDGNGADSSDEEEVDEQDMIDNRDENEDKTTGNTDLLAQIKSKHMQLISRTWIVASIIVQALIILCAAVLAWQGTLYHFQNDAGNLTVLFFWPHVPGNPTGDYNFNHSGPKFWWFQFGDLRDCQLAKVNDEQTCEILQNVRYSNSFLVGGLGLAYIFTCLSALFLTLMFLQKYYRITNLVLLIPALCFMSVPFAWYFVSDAKLEETLVRYKIIVFYEVFGVLELVCFLGGRHYANKLYGADFTQMLLEDICDSDSEVSEEDGPNERQPEEDLFSDILGNQAVERPFSLNSSQDPGSYQSQTLEPTKMTAVSQNVDP